MNYQIYIIIRIIVIVTVVIVTIIRAVFSVVVAAVVITVHNIPIVVIDVFVHDTTVVILTPLDFFCKLSCNFKIAVFSSLKQAFRKLSYLNVFVGSFEVQSHSW